MPPVFGWPTGDTHQFGLPCVVVPNSSVASRGSPVTTRAFGGLSGRAGLANHSQPEPRKQERRTIPHARDFHEDTNQNLHWLSRVLCRKDAGWTRVENGKLTA